jgi:hypothetical protein
MVSYTWACRECRGCVCTTGLHVRAFNSTIVYLFFETSCNFHLLFEKNPESEKRAQKDDSGKRAVVRVVQIQQQHCNTPLNTIVPLSSSEIFVVIIIHL